MANAYYNAFRNIFQEAPFRLFCNWHVEKAWKENLSKVRGKEKKVLGKFCIRKIDAFMYNFISFNNYQRTKC